MRLNDALVGILDLARLEGGSYRLEEDMVALGEAIATAADAVSAGAQQKGALICMPPDGILPAIRADARAIHKIVVALLSNAVKFSGKDGRIAVSGDLEPSGGYRLSIADNGIGIPEERLATVLQPFQQADASLARKYEGVGLGLSLASKLMQLHDGSLAIASAPNAGTTVTLLFPAARVAFVG
jgi:signal transduction histidine kinase